MTLGSARPASYDAIIVGARCAGAATAMLLARRGLRVLAIDRGRYGTDTLSTHALMRAGVVLLHRWGVLEGIQAAGTPLLRSTSFHYDDKVVAIPIKPKDGIQGLSAPRRTVIDAQLVDAARAAGAEVAFDTQLVGLLRADGDRVCGVRCRTGHGQELQIRAGIVIGADGVRSSVARLVGAPYDRIGHHATGLIFSYWPVASGEGYHWYFRQGVSAGVIPTNDGLACVFVSVPQSRFRDEFRLGPGEGHARLMRTFWPDLADRLDSTQRADRYRGFGGEVGYFRRSWGPGWALVGDAGYFKDPLTAHGITDALIDAESLAHAVAAGSEHRLEAYQRARDERAAGLFDVTDAVASFDWDIPKVQELHRSLSDEMKKETLEVTQLA